MEHTKVEYVDHTFSPWHGCSRVSPGCVHCFAETLTRRWGADLWHAHGPRRVVSDAQWREPVKWNRKAQAEGRRHRILCGTMCDVLEPHPGVVEARARLFRLVEDTPWLMWCFFTKRPEQVPALIPWEWQGDGSWPGNTALITSVENQPWADVRIPVVLDSGAPVKGLSVEPLIGPVHLGMCDWTPAGSEGFPGVHNPLTGEWWPAVGDPAAEYEGRITDLPRLDWVIVGGESGPQSRPMELDWARSVVRECTDAGVAVYVKQLGAVAGKEFGAGSKGGDLEAWPPELQVRQLPAAAYWTPRVAA